MATGGSKLSGKTEDRTYIEDIGVGHQEYMRVVAAWNVLKVLRTRLLRGGGVQ